MKAPPNAEVFIDFCTRLLHDADASVYLQVPMSDLFGAGGTALLDRTPLPGPYRARVHSLRRILEGVGLRDRSVYQVLPHPALL